MRIKVTTGIRLVMSFGIMIVVMGLMEFIQGKSTLENTLVGVVGCTLLFGGIGLFAGIRNFGWDTFKNYVLLQPATGIWFGAAAVLGIMSAFQ